MKKQERGFTLIEMMVVVMIIAILTAIAIPAYQRYTVLNAEKQVQAQMGQIAVQLERWRAKTLSYKGFEPYKDGDYGYDNPTGNDRWGVTVTPKTLIYLPVGSNKSNYSYMIQLVDGASLDSRLGVDADKGLSLTADLGDDRNFLLGKSWKMAAYPHNKLKDRGAKKFMMGSNGMRCLVSNGRNFRQLTFLKDSCTGTGVESW